MMFRNLFLSTSKMVLNVAKGFPHGLSCGRLLNNSILLWLGADLQQRDYAFDTVRQI